jgi:hypothetical protein
MRSTGGPLESAMIRCPAGHYFCGAIESLTWDGKDKHDPGPAGLGSRAGRDSLQRSHDGRHGGGGSRSGDIPAEPDRDVCRPNTAPAYYLGRPARLYITAIGRAAGAPRPITRSKLSPVPGNERHPATAAPSPAPGPKQPA